MKSLRDGQYIHLLFLAGSVSGGLNNVTYNGRVIKSPKPSPSGYCCRYLACAMYIDLGSPVDPEECMMIAVRFCSFVMFTSLMYGVVGRSGLS